MSGCSRWNSADGLQETSNCYCHPGIAGGSPADARVHPTQLEVWDIRAIEPSPGIRGFGCFGDRDLFIVLTYEYRENLDATANGFAIEARRCRQVWDFLFSSVPYGGGVSDLLTNFYLS